MATPTNKDKNIVIDESILDETPPNINESQGNEEETPVEVPEDKIEVTPEVTITPEKVEIKNEDGSGTVISEETLEQKDQRYKAQQTEAQIQVARNRELITKVDDASKIPEPTVEELKAFVAQDGVTWDELTTFEQSMAKKTYLSEKRFSLVNEAVQSTKKIDEWATKIDTFIDSTDSKPEYIKLSGHEADFRKFCMKEAHRGAPIEVLLGSFLYQLPAPKKIRNSLFETGGGGEKVNNSGKITDADQVAALRTGTQEQQREYRRLVRAGKIDLEA